MHWSDQYIGKPYIRHEYDCSHLVVEVMAEQFGRAVALPAAAEGIRDRDRQIEHMTSVLARPLEANEPAREGDVALMRAAGRRVSLGHHVGLLMVIEGDLYVLHCLADIGVVRHPLRDLFTRCLELTEICRWI